jgi:glucose-1-phosphate thymidylyltransferase
MTLNTPKALLKVGTKTILGHILDKVFQVDNISNIYIISNHRFYESFNNWLKSAKLGEKIEILDDGTTSNEDRLGAIGDINFALKTKKIDDNLLILGSDNLFEFNLKKFVEFGEAKKPFASLALYDVKDIKKARLYGIAVLKKGSDEIEDFEEKPETPKSTLAATAIYYCPKEKTRELDAYLEAGISKDAPGNFVKWLSKKESVYGYVFKEKWFDIGSQESLRKADEEYKKKGEVKC